MTPLYFSVPLLTFHDRVNDDREIDEFGRVDLSRQIQADNAGKRPSGRIGLGTSSFIELTFIKDLSRERRLESPVYFGQDRNENPTWRERRKVDGGNKRGNGSLKLQLHCQESDPLLSISVARGWIGGVRERGQLAERPTPAVPLAATLRDC